MMIMQVGRQDFDDVTGHMYLKFIFIGQTFLCKEKTSQNKQIPVRPANSEHMQHQDQDYVKDKDLVWPRLKFRTLSKFMFLTIL